MSLTATPTRGASFCPLVKIRIQYDLYSVVFPVNMIGVCGTSLSVEFVVGVVELSKRALHAGSCAGKHGILSCYMVILLVAMPSLAGVDLAYKWGLVRESYFK